MGAGGWWWLGPGLLSGTVAAGADVIAVVPFTANGPGVAALGEGMVDLLSTNLDEVGAIRTVDGRMVMRAWQAEIASATSETDPALATGQAVGAGSVVVGSVVEAGAEVQMNAQLLTVNGEELATAQVRGPAAEVLTLVDSLTVSLVRDIWRSREPVPRFEVAAITTGSLEAIRQYLEGEAWFRRSQWDSAVAHFDAAVREDSTFALAHHRLASAYGWLELLGSPNARAHATTAYDLRERLPERENALVVANYLWYEGQTDEALDSARAFVERAPDDADGWFQLGDIQFHARLRQLQPAELRAPFERVLELDPSLTPALFHPRFNRRTSRARGLLFYRLLEQAVQCAPTPASALYLGTGRGKRPAEPR